MQKINKINGLKITLPKVDLSFNNFKSNLNKAVDTAKGKVISLIKHQGKVIQIILDKAGKLEKIGFDATFPIFIKFFRYNIFGLANAVVLANKINSSTTKAIFLKYFPISDAQYQVILANCNEAFTKKRSIITINQATANVDFNLNDPFGSSPSFSFGELDDKVGKFSMFEPSGLNGDTIDVSTENNPNNDINMQDIRLILEIFKELLPMFKQLYTDLMEFIKSKINKPNQTDEDILNNPPPVTNNEPNSINNTLLYAGGGLILLTLLFKSK